MNRFDTELAPQQIGFRAQRWSIAQWKLGAVLNE